MKKITFGIAVASFLNFAVCLFLGILQIEDYKFFEFTSLILSFGPTLIFLLAKMEMPEQKKKISRLLLINVFCFFSMVCFLAYNDQKYEYDAVFAWVTTLMVCIYNVVMIGALIMYVFPGPANEKEKTALE